MGFRALASVVCACVLLAFLFSARSGAEPELYAVSPSFQAPGRASGPRAPAKVGPPSRTASSGPEMVSVAPVAEAAGTVAWLIAKTGLLDTTAHLGDGVGDLLAATSPSVASLGTEVPLEHLNLLREPPIGYDWRTNSKDLRFLLMSCVPFGLLFIGISLQRTTRQRTTQASFEEDEESKIAALAGRVPPETCLSTVAISPVTEMRDFRA